VKIREEKDDLGKKKENILYSILTFSKPLIQYSQGEVQNV